MFCTSLREITHFRIHPSCVILSCFWHVGGEVLEFPPPCCQPSLCTTILNFANDKLHPLSFDEKIPLHNILLTNVSCFFFFFFFFVFFSWRRRARARSLSFSFYRFEDDGEIVYRNTIDQMKSDELMTLYVNYEHLVEFSETVAKAIKDEFYSKRHHNSPPPLLLLLLLILIRPCLQAHPHLCPSSSPPPPFLGSPLTFVDPHLSSSLIISHNLPSSPIISHHV